MDARYAQAIPREAEAMLMVEQQADEAREVIESLQQVAIRWQRRRRLAFGFHLALAPEEFDLFRRLARRVSPTLYRVQGHERPTPFVEDIAVPPEALPSFWCSMQNVLKTHQVTASLFAHAGHGQIARAAVSRLSRSGPTSARCRIWPTDLYDEVLASAARSAASTATASAARGSCGSSTARCTTCSAR